MNGEGEKGVEKGDQWEDADSSEETFFLDPDGRVPFAGEVSFDFRSAPEALASSLSKPGVLDRVHADCQVVFSARAKKLAYSTGKTFWVQADAQPRNSLESLALAIFEAHTANARFNRKTSGAEWWTQVIEGEDDIGWHWDKDYGMEARGINVHPCLATVTYLSDLGGPTVILEKRGPMACQDVEGVSGGATRAWISAPRVGKHICFDGRYLHAAPADLAPILRSGSRSPARDAGADASTDAGANASADASADASTDAGSNAFDENIAGISDGSIGEGGIGAVARVKKRQRDGETKLHSYRDGSNGINKTISNSNGSSSSNTSNGTSNGISTSNTSDTGSNKRVTFLVNVWLNHTPKTACPLSAEKAAALGSYQLAEEFSATAVDELFVHPRALQVCMAKEAFPELGIGDQAIARASTPEAERKRCYLETGAETGDDPGRCVGQGSRVGERGQSEEVADAVGMRWEFGEVGDEAGGRVHLRHEVFMPLPVGLAKPGCVGGRDSEVVVAGGGSLCLEYVGGAKPRVSGVGGWGSVGGDVDDDEDEEDDDEEDDDEDEEDDIGGEDDDDEEDGNEGDNVDDDDDNVGEGGE